MCKGSRTQLSVPSFIFLSLSLSFSLSLSLSLSLMHPFSIHFSHLSPLCFISLLLLSLLFSFYTLLFLLFSLSQMNHSLSPFHSSLPSLFPPLLDRKSTRLHSSHT